ncbi:MAG: SDR family NAD(P)-dependent oxidoreductase [Clostridiales bacterium]|nr:SDR family NAD(P)-dependent oxidoreductase [Clostridiales bacterium]
MKNFYDYGKNINSQGFDNAQNDAVLKFRKKSARGGENDAMFNPSDDSAAVFDSGSGFSRDSVYSPASAASAYENDESVLDAGSGFDNALGKAAAEPAENGGFLPRENASSENFDGGSAKSRNTVYSFAASSPNPWTEADLPPREDAEFFYGSESPDARSFEAAVYYDTDEDEDFADSGKFGKKAKNSDGGDINANSDKTGSNADNGNTDINTNSDTADASGIIYGHGSDDESRASQTARKILFIIGASDGIGKHTAELFLEKGYAVYNGSRTPCYADGVRNITLDAAEPTTVDAAVNEIIAREGRIDTLIYSAGFSLSAPLEHTAESDYRYLFEVNFFGFARAAKNVIPHMRAAGGGKIIAVSSMGGIFPIAFDCFYSASKAALNMFVKSLAIEVEPYGIKVSALMPGGTATGFTRKRKIYPPALAGIYEKQISKANAALADDERNGMPPVKVAAALLAAAESENPPHTDAVGLKNKALAAADKLLPETLTAMLVKTKYHQQR